MLLNLPILYSLDYETDDLSNLRITISSGAWRILKENIAKFINFDILSESRRYYITHFVSFLKDCCKPDCTSAILIFNKEV